MSRARYIPVQTPWGQLPFGDSVPNGTENHVTVPSILVSDICVGVQLRETIGIDTTMRKDYSGDGRGVYGREFW